jgi:hypothetical protein
MSKLQRHQKLSHAPSGQGLQFALGDRLHSPWLVPLALPSRQPLALPWAAPLLPPLLPPSETSPWGMVKSSGAQSSQKIPAPYLKLLEWSWMYCMNLYESYTSIKSVWANRDAYSIKVVQRVQVFPMISTGDLKSKQALNNILWAKPSKTIISVII